MKFRSRMELGDITHHNLKQLKRLNQVIFPVSYNEKFYKDVLEAGNLAKFVYFNDIVVGAVCCRIDTSDGRKRLYIMTLGCLYQYRRLGLGTIMLEHVFDLCRSDSKINGIFLHVQINNDSALSFYERFGFQRLDMIKNYYKRIEPADAFILERDLDTDPLPLVPATPLVLEEELMSAPTVTHPALVKAPLGQSNNIDSTTAEDKPDSLPRVPDTSGNENVSGVPRPTAGIEICNGNMSPPAGVSRASADEDRSQPQGRTQGKRGRGKK